MYPILQILFLLSGWTALVDQIIWVRLMSLTFGSTVQSISAVLGIFLGGLAVGAQLAGRYAERFRNPLVIYGIAELLTGVLAFASLPLMDRFAPELCSALPVSIAALATSVIVLLPATVCMGATLPLLIRCCIHDNQTLKTRLTDLYAINVLGAMFGCLTTGFFLIPELGCRTTMFIAAGTNILLALVVWRTQRGTADSADCNSRGSLADIQETLADGFAIRIRNLVIAGLAGFLFLGVEVLWTRLFQTMLTSNVLVYTVLAASFLGGMAGAAFLCRFISGADRVHYWLITVSVLNGLLVLAAILFQEPIGMILDDVHASPSDPGSVSGGRVLVVLFAFCLIPSVGLGLVFPLLLKHFCRAHQTAPAGVGALLSANTLGSIIGTLGTGFLLLPWLGMNLSLLLIATGYAAMTLLLTEQPAARVAAAATAAIALAIGFPVLKQNPNVWFNGGFTQVSLIPARNVLVVHEGAQATTAIVETGGELGLLINGTIVAETTRRDLWDLLLKAHLPMVMHPRPQRVALVGLGAGVSLGAVLAHDVQQVDCAELCPEVLQVQSWFQSVNGSGWTDRRARIILNDGRSFLETSEQLYDVISVDPIDPPICNQYSLEFLELCRERLRPDGIMVQWVPLFHMRTEHVQIIIETFDHVFPDGMIWYDGTSILLSGTPGRAEPIDVDVCLARSRTPDVQQSLRLIDSPATEILLGMWVGNISDYRRVFPEPLSPTTDDRPFLEYLMLMRPAVERMSHVQNLEMLLSVWRFGPLPSRLWTGTPDSLRAVERSRELMRRMLIVRIAKMQGDASRSAELEQAFDEDYRLNPQARRTLAPFLGE